MNWSHRRVLLPVLSASLLLAAPALRTVRSGKAYAQDAINHDSLMNDDIQSYGRQALMEDALRHHTAPQPGQGAGGPEVDLNIVFPPNQTGLENVNVIMLVPKVPGAHECEALAQVHGTRIFSVFIPGKDVKPGHSYIVVASDARNDNYRIGQINVGAGGRQSFTINAPLLTPNSPQLQRQGPVQTPVPGAGPANNAAQIARLRQQMRPWSAGIVVATITPALLAAVGHPGARVRGLVVLTVVPGSPAAQAGIGPGDVITQVNGQPCTDARQLGPLTANREHGAPTTFLLYSQKRHGFGTVIVPVNQQAVAPNLPQHAYVPPAIGPGLVQPKVGPGFVPPTTDHYQPPKVGPGFIEPGTNTGQPTIYHPVPHPPVKPIFHPLPRPPVKPIFHPVPRPPIKPIFHPLPRPPVKPVFHPVPRPPIKPIFHPVPRPPVKPVFHPVPPTPVKPPPPSHPNPPANGSNKFQHPTTGPGFQRPGAG